MTAQERYWLCTGSGLLPATVPIQVGTSRGIATCGYNIHGSVQAERLALGDRRKQRGIAAIMVCRDLHRSTGRISNLDGETAARTEIP